MLNDARVYNLFERSHYAAAIRLKLLLIVTAWLLIVALSLGWNLHQAEQHRENLALESARTFFDLLLITRRWNARHAGIYVPITPQTPANPYLKDPQRDLQITPDLTLTKVNPAYMTRTLGAGRRASGRAVSHHQFETDSPRKYRLRLGD